ncbi:MAG: hypothetical protein OEZ01_07845 [Candidatus Heimdallarchaeota archaeon]|nr:hypothetical protein [Candidatus Heimdallarchaeota archaeon]
MIDEVEEVLKEYLVLVGYEILELNSDQLNSTGFNRIFNSLDIDDREIFFSEFVNQLNANDVDFCQMIEKIDAIPIR